MRNVKHEVGSWQGQVDVYKHHTGNIPSLVFPSKGASWLRLILLITESQHGVKLLLWERKMVSEVGKHWDESGLSLFTAQTAV